MKVAVVGANFLGCSTAHYVRRALAQNRSQAAEGDGADRKRGESDDTDGDEIVIFEQSNSVGGQKFHTLSLGRYSTPVGTASSVDVSSSPLLQSLIKDASLPQPSAKPASQWSIFDWDADAYCVSKYRSSFLASIASSMTIMIILQLAALASSWFFATQLPVQGISLFLTRRFDKEHGQSFNYLKYHFVLWFMALLWLAGGFIPMRWVFNFHNYLVHVFAVRVTSSVIYGFPSMSHVYTITNIFREHLALVDKHDSGTSGITLSHLLAACGMGKYVRKTMAEFLGPFNVSSNYLAQCVWPSMCLSYASCADDISSRSNALASLCSMSGTALVPSSLRTNAICFSADDTDKVCPALIKSASAQVRLNTRIVSVMKRGDDQYDLHAGVDGNEVNVGTFDVVLIAAVMDAKQFKSDAYDIDTESIFSLKYAEQNKSASSRGNTARFVSLVRGDIKPSFFRLSNAKQMPDQMYILNSINTCQVCRVSENVWKVTSTEKVDPESAVANSLFESIEKSVSFERSPPKYPLLPLSKSNLSSEPNIILARRFINVAAIDRVCSDINMECIAARNAASLLRDGVVTWK